MTITIVTPPGNLPDRYYPLEWTADEPITGVSVQFTAAAGPSARESAYDGTDADDDDGTFSAVYAESTIVAGAWTLVRDGGWPAALQLRIKPATGATIVATFTPPAPDPELEIGGPEAYYQREIRTARDTLLQIVPKWLRQAIGGGLLTALGAQVDMLTDYLRFGMRARVPGYQPEATVMIGRDRRLRQGLHETDDHFVNRLPYWWEKHAARGGPYAMLEQIYEYFAPLAFPVELRYATGRRFLMDVNGNVTRDIFAWTPPGDPARWARWWLFYTWPATIDDDGIWSDPGEWNDGGVWDANLSPADVRMVRLIPREWNAAHSIGYVTLDSSALGGIIITISVETT